MSRRRFQIDFFSRKMSFQRSKNKEINENNFKIKKNREKCADFALKTH